MHLCMHRFLGEFILRQLLQERANRDRWWTDSGHLALLCSALDWLDLPRKGPCHLRPIFYIDMFRTEQWKRSQSIVQKNVHHCQSILASQYQCTLYLFLIVTWIYSRRRPPSFRRLNTFNALVFLEISSPCRTNSLEQYFSLGKNGSISQSQLGLEESSNPASRFLLLYVPYVYCSASLGKMT